MHSPSLAFLERDFNQCFAQMRHYDSQLWDIAKFSFAGYTVVLGATAALYQYSRETGLDLIPAALVVVVVAFILGVVFLAIAIRNRVYFVVLARYINEHRRFFLEDRPGGFSNPTDMYTNPSYPPYFNLMSSQSAMVYAIAALNAALPAVIPFLTSADRALTYAAAFFLALLGAQLWIVIRYLLSCEAESPSAILVTQGRGANDVE